MGHEDAAAEIGFGEDVWEGGGVVDVETGMVLAMVFKGEVVLWWEQSVYMASFRCRHGESSDQTRM